MKTITAVYQVEASWDIEDLGIDWSKVETYFIKYNQLVVVYEDGSTDEYAPTEDYTETYDFKRPDTIKEVA